jgi:hypothetical protein
VNFWSLRYRGTIITGPWTPLLLGHFSADTFSSNVRLVVFPMPPAVCFYGCDMNGGVSISEDNFVCVMNVRTVADPCPRNFLWVIVVCGEASYYKSKPTSLINRFFCRLWRSSHVWTRSRGHNHSNARPSKVSIVIFVKNIIFIFIWFFLLYYYNTFGAYVILLLFSVYHIYYYYYFFFFLLILLWRFWPVYLGICYNFINYPC